MRRLCLAALLLAALPPTAQAQDYPFSGTFTLSGSPDGPDPDDPARCALSFFTENPNGAFINYVVDMEAFNTTKTLHYRVMAYGTCTYDAAHRMETCKSEFDIDKSISEESYVDVIDSIAPDFIKLTNFINTNYAKDYAATGKPEGAYFRTALVRCPFNLARLTAAISADVTSLSPDDAQKLLAPDATLLHAPIMADLIKAAGLSKP